MTQKWLQTITHTKVSSWGVDVQYLNHWPSRLFDNVANMDPAHPNSKSTDYVLEYSALPYSKGTAVAQWLRCCATKRKFAGSIPDGVIEIFRLLSASEQ